MYIFKATSAPPRAGTTGISSLRNADSIHIIYIDLELIYLYFENAFGCNGVGSDSSEECHFLR